MTKNRWQHRLWEQITCLQTKRRHMFQNLWLDFPPWTSKTLEFPEKNPGWKDIICWWHGVNYSCNQTNVHKCSAAYGKNAWGEVEHLMPNKRYSLLSQSSCTIVFRVFRPFSGNKNQIDVGWERVLPELTFSHWLRTFSFKIRNAHCARRWLVPGDSLSEEPNGHLNKKI